MYYYHIALNIPIGLLTYAYSEPLPEGRRVLVPFRGRQALGVVWAAGITPDIAVEKILTVAKVFDEEPLLPESWRALVDFAARYYHYPVGQTVFAALPQALREAKAVAVPQPEMLYRLNHRGLSDEPPARAPKQRALWQALHQACSQDALKKVHPQAVTLLKEWLQRGNIETVQAALPPIPPPVHDLNAEQRAAVADIVGAQGCFQAFVLHGITGSGKTEVYFEAAAHMLRQGKQVLFMLPEINLTPQLLQRLQQRFPEVPLAVLHSQTAAGQRSKDYLRALLGQAKLIIGTRLSVFTPLPELGLLIVDEEHDGSFKQDSELRYHARDLAVWRAYQADCPIVLGSATPSLESWHKVRSGSYRLLLLPNRAHSQAQPPQIHILDTRRMTLEHGIAPQLLQMLQNNRAQGGLSLVYLNRRGFAPALFCGDCGHTFGCPNCSAKTVLHQRIRQLRCHHCGFRQPVPHACPDCGNQDLTAVGQGTQRIEETLRRLLPEARIARVDRDSVSGRHDWQHLYRDIADNRVDILIGTQMLAKGHDFARLNLVIVVNADGSLYSSDFRAVEHLFAELMQVSGRAGRAESRGQVWIQTRLPEHPIFAAVRNQNYPLFADSQLKEREDFGLPPYIFQAAVRADAASAETVQHSLQNVKNLLAPALPDKLHQFGPAPMLLTRLEGRERAQLFLESGDRKAVHRAASLWLAALHDNAPHGMRYHVDIDPQEM